MSEVSPENREHTLPMELARSSLALLEAYEDFRYNLFSTDLARAKEKSTQYQEIELSPISDAEIEDSKDLVYMDQEIFIASIQGWHESRTAEDWANDLEERTLKMRLLFTDFVKIIIDNLQPGQKLETQEVVNQSGTVKSKVIIDKESGVVLVESGEYFPAFNPYSDNEFDRHLLALDLCVLIPHVSRAAIELINTKS